jgi:hypothetical protein
LHAAFIIRTETQTLVRPTYYTIRSVYLKSWVVESSRDGADWIEFDRKWKNEDFKAGWARLLFHPIKSDRQNCLFIRAFGLFATLIMKLYMA